jgi:hypothetical protein
MRNIDTLFAIALCIPIIVVGLAVIFDKGR